MENRIIQLTKIKDKRQCLQCGEREATVAMLIAKTKSRDSVIWFDMCDRCLAQAQQDIQKICE